MQQQDDLFKAEALSVEVPKGISEPRLWVRRLKIWDAPDGEVIRDIELRPGLNIVWSPDGRDDPDAPGEHNIGHGSGKTLFCRLLRYCLGETRFADEIQREAISMALPNGIVGAEVILDGVCWGVARPIGIGRKHFAVANGELDELARMEGPATGIDPLVDAIESTVVTDGVARLARLPHGQRAWPIALAWLSRDQECRFDDTLDWRSPSSGSETPQPASGEAKGPRLQALRAFLMALTEEEQVNRQRELSLSSQIETAKRNVSFLEWEQRRRLGMLVNELGLSDKSLPEMPLLLDYLKRAAEQELATASGLPSGDNSEISGARSAAQRARARLRAAELKSTRLESELPLQETLLRQLNSDIPGLSAAANVAASPICPICEVPIDTALAEGCKLSHKIPNADECRARLEAKRQEIRDQKQTVEALNININALKPELALASQAVRQAEERVRRLEEASDQRASGWRRAARLVDEVQRYADLSAELAASLGSSRDLESELQKIRDLLRSFEDKQAKTFGAISEKFSAIIRLLIGDDAKGAVRLTGKGLEISVQAGGDRRTAAIESLKVLAFDLACLCLSIEHRTRAPAFIIHDSPREADLGLTIYDSYFTLLRALEESLAGPVFQYIVTTTTRPSPELNREPWRRLIVRGSPGSERLLRRDL